MDFIETREQLRALYGEPTPRAVRKQLAALDGHMRDFIATSPFVLIGSQDEAGRADVTPKGDLPGFVAVLDDTTIAVPDRPGNNRLDTLQNVLGNPAVGLLFLVPGKDETLRLNGTARLTADPDLCARLGVNGKPARSVMVVAISEVFMHCAKAFIRSGLWKPGAWPDISRMPSLGQVLRDQIAASESADQIDASLAENYRRGLW